MRVHYNMRTTIFVFTDDGVDLPVRQFKKEINDYVNKMYPHTIKGTLIIRNRKFSDGAKVATITTNAVRTCRKFEIISTFSTNTVGITVFNWKQDIKDLMIYICDKYCVPFGARLDLEEKIIKSVSDAEYIDDYPLQSTVYVNGKDNEWP